MRIRTLHLYLGALQFEGGGKCFYPMCMIGWNFSSGNLTKTLQAALLISDIQNVHYIIYISFPKVLQSIIVM